MGTWPFSSLGAGVGVGGRDKEDKIKFQKIKIQPHYTDKGRNQIFFSSDRGEAEG